MFVDPKLDYSTNRELFYQNLVQEMEHHLCEYGISNLANASALLMKHLPNINWVGFYLWDGQKLRLGPFQGLPACLEISLGRGVCGTSAIRRQSLIVPNVDEFPGHIVCDSNSRSEIVIPLVTADGQLRGVLDVDSPLLSRFDEIDRQGLEKLVMTLLGKAAAFKI
jgi:L-methionine (R)-S-oxide reductase